LGKTFGNSKPRSFLKAKSVATNQGAFIKRRLLFSVLK